MSNEPQPPTTPPVPPPPSAPAGDASQLDALNSWAQSFAAREKREGKSQALREVAEQLGMTLDEAKTFIEQAKEAQRATLDEAGQKLAAAEEKERKANEATAKAAKAELDVAKVLALIEAGVEPKQARALVDMVRVEKADWEDDDVAQAVEQLKTITPQLFPLTDDVEENPPAGGAPKPPDGKVRGTPPRTKPAGDAKARAQARLAERHPRYATKE